MGIRLHPAAELTLPDRVRDRSFLLPMPGVHYGQTLVERIEPDPQRRRALLNRHTGLDQGQVKAALEFWAAVLRDHAEDVLSGDLSFLDARRTRPYPPPTLRLMVHRSLTDRAVTARVARVRAVFPDADLTVDRYPAHRDHDVGSTRVTS